MAPPFSTQTELDAARGFREAWRDVLAHPGYTAATALPARIKSLDDPRKGFQAKKALDRFEELTRPANPMAGDPGGALAKGFNEFGHTQLRAPSALRAAQDIVEALKLQDLQAAQDVASARRYLPIAVKLPGTKDEVSRLRERAKQGSILEATPDVIENERRAVERGKLIRARIEAQRAVERREAEKPSVGQVYETSTLEDARKAAEEQALADEGLLEGTKLSDLRKEDGTRYVSKEDVIDYPELLRAEDAHLLQNPQAKGLGSYVLDGAGRLLDVPHWLLRLGTSGIAPISDAAVQDPAVFTQELRQGRAGLPGQALQGAFDLAGGILEAPVEGVRTLTDAANRAARRRAVSATVERENQRRAKDAGIDLEAWATMQPDEREHALAQAGTASEGLLSEPAEIARRGLAPRGLVGTANNFVDRLNQQTWGGDLLHLLTLEPTNALSGGAGVVGRGARSAVKDPMARALRRGAVPEEAAGAVMKALDEPLDLGTATGRRLAREKVYKAAPELPGWAPGRDGERGIADDVMAEAWGPSGEFLGRPQFGLRVPHADKVAAVAQGGAEIASASKHPVAQRVASALRSVASKAQGASVPKPLSEVFPGVPDYAVGRAKIRAGEAVGQAVKGVANAAEGVAQVADSLAPQGLRRVRDAARGASRYADQVAARSSIEGSRQSREAYNRMVQARGLQRLLSERWAEGATKLMRDFGGDIEAPRMIDLIKQATDPDYRPVATEAGIEIRPYYPRQTPNANPMVPPTQVKPREQEFLDALDKMMVDVEGIARRAGSPFGTNKNPASGRYYPRDYSLPVSPRDRTLHQPVVAGRGGSSRVNRTMEVIDEQGDTVMVPLTRSGAQVELDALQQERRAVLEEMAGVPKGNPDRDALDVEIRASRQRLNESRAKLKAEKFPAEVDEELKRLEKARAAAQARSRKKGISPEEAAAAKQEAEQMAAQKAALREKAEAEKLSRSGVAQFEAEVEALESQRKQMSPHSPRRIELTQLSRSIRQKVLDAKNRRYGPDDDLQVVGQEPLTMVDTGGGRPLGQPLEPGMQAEIDPYVVLPRYFEQKARQVASAELEATLAREHGIDPSKVSPLEASRMRKFKIEPEQLSSEPIVSDDPVIAEASRRLRDVADREQVAPEFEELQKLRLELARVRDQIAATKGAQRRVFERGEYEKAKFADLQLEGLQAEEDRIFNELAKARQPVETDDVLRDVSETQEKHRLMLNRLEEAIKRRVTDADEAKRLEREIEAKRKAGVDAIERGAPSLKRQRTDLFRKREREQEQMKKWQTQLSEREREVQRVLKRGTPEEVETQLDELGKTLKTKKKERTSLRIKDALRRKKAEAEAAEKVTEGAVDEAAGVPEFEPDPMLAALEKEVGSIERQISRVKKQQTKLKSSEFGKQTALRDTASKQVAERKQAVEALEAEIRDVVSRIEQIETASLEEVGKLQERLKALAVDDAGLEALKGKYEELFHTVARMNESVAKAKARALAQEVVPMERLVEEHVARYIDQLRSPMNGSFRALMEYAFGESRNFLSRSVIELGSALDATTNWWKRLVLAGRPAYNALNVVTDTATMYTAGVDVPLRISQAVEGARTNDRITKELASFGIDVVPMKLGMRGMLPFQDTLPGKGPAKMRRLDAASALELSRNPSALESRMRDAAAPKSQGARWNRATEGLMRVTTIDGERSARLWESISKAAMYRHAREELKLGPAEAMDLTLKTLIDYEMRSSVEAFLKPFMGFTRWMFASPGAQLKALSMNPGRAVAVQRVEERAGGESDLWESPSEYARKRGLVRGAPPVLRDIYSATRSLAGTPLEDAEDLTISPRASSFREALAPYLAATDQLGLTNLNTSFEPGFAPIPTAFAEWMTQRSLQTWRPLKTELGTLFPKGTPRLGGLVPDAMVATSDDQKGWFAQDIVPLLVGTSGTTMLNILANAMGDEATPHAVFGETRQPRLTSRADSLFPQVINQISPFPFSVPPIGRSLMDLNQSDAVRRAFDYAPSAKKLREEMQLRQLLSP